MKKAIIALALVAIATAAVPVINKAIIDTVNNRPQRYWTAGINSIFADKTDEDIKRMLGLKLMTPAESRRAALMMPNPNPPSLEQLKSIPASFDARQQWPNCVHPIRNQGQCGSCWAFGSTESLSDRFCIQSNGTQNVVLSPEWVVSCDNTNMGCNGGNLAAVWDYLKSSGTVVDSCLPYTSGLNGTVPQCPSDCADGSTPQFYKAKTAYQVSGLWPIGRVAKIQHEIMTNGPVESGFSVYADFPNYVSGVYRHVSGNLLGGHAIKIIGWGEENNTPYWLVANSWGTSWGLSGFFKILRGKNECGIEADVYAGLAAV